MRRCEGEDTVRDEILARGRWFKGIVRSVREESVNAPTQREPNSHYLRALHIMVP